MIRFACGHCGRPINVDARYAGKKGKCPKCGNVVIVPERSTIITFHCGKCGQKIEVPAGRKGRCPKCGNAVIVPAGKEKPVERGSAVTVTCSMCGQVIGPVDGSQDPFMECPGCGSYIETSSGGIAPESGASVPPGADEDLVDDSSDTADSPAGPDRRPIILVSAVAAVLVLGCVVLVVALRSSGSRSAERPEGLPGQEEVTTTGLPAQPVVPTASPGEPVVQGPASEGAAPKRATEPKPTAETAGTTRLQFRPASGTRRTVQLDTKLTMSMDEGGQRYNTTNTRSIDLDLAVTESPGDGTVAIHVTLAAIREKSDMQGQTVAEYDSSKPRGEGDVVPGIYASFLGNRFTIKVSRRGEIIDSGLDGLFRAAAERRVQDEDDALRERLKDKADQAIRRTDERFGSRGNRVLALKKQLEEFPVFGREQMAGLLSSLLVALPDKPMRSGDTWEGPLTVDMGERLQMAATYTLTAVEQSVCTIQAAGQRSLDEEPLVSEGGQMKVSSKLGGSSRATLQIDRQTGWLLSKKHTTSLQGEMKRTATGPQPQDVSGQVSLEITSVLTTLK